MPCPSLAFGPWRRLTFDGCDDVAAPTPHIWVERRGAVALAVRHRRHRQRDVEGRSFSFRALGPDLAPV